MAIYSKANHITESDPVCQGDVFSDVKYSYIELEDDLGVNIVEMEFPLAIIISQACDVTAMDEMCIKKSGKPTKFMPSILLCPIYDRDTAKKGEHILEAFAQLEIAYDHNNLFDGQDKAVFQRDFHYRFHDLSVMINNEVLFEHYLIDFKHYFCVPAMWLRNNISKRLFTLDDFQSSKITSKFAAFLARIAIP